MLVVIRQFHDGIEECVRLDDVESARKRSTWGKDLDKGACSRHCCSTLFPQRYCVWPRNVSSPMQPSQTTWCSLNERRRTWKRWEKLRTDEVDGRGWKEENDVGAEVAGHAEH